MLNIKGSPQLRRIVVLNPKGGVGKSTLASNLAGYFATSGRKVAIIDMDRQGSSTHWLGRRPAEFPVIHGVFADPDLPGALTDIGINLPAEIDLVIIDTPAGILSEDLGRFTSGSHAVIVPVMPSEFDIHAASRLIADLLIEARISRENQRLGVIANRVKERTIAFKQLMRFLKRLSIPVIGVIRDSQNYVSATREGVSIHELTPSQAGKDLKYWEPVIEWLEERLATPLNDKDTLRSNSAAPAIRPVRRFGWKYAMLALLALFAISLLFWNSGFKPEPDLVSTDTLEQADKQQISAAGAENSTLAKETVTDTLTTPQPVDAQQQVDEVARQDKDDTQIVVEPQQKLTDLGTQPDQVADGSGSESSEAPLTPAQQLMQKWRFKGVARAGGELFAILADSSGELTRTVTTSDGSVDGWRLKEADTGYALFEKDGEEVRLNIGQ